MPLFPYYSLYMTTLLFSKPSAYAFVKGISSYSNIQGMVLFYDIEDGMIVSADFNGLPSTNENDRDENGNQKETRCNGTVLGFHIHEGERCSGTKEDPLADVGMHLNPDRCEHPYHMGDMPPLFSNNGKAWFAFYTERFHIWDIIGRTVVVHSKQDDFTTQPSGNAGEKIACGVIKRM